MRSIFCRDFGIDAEKNRIINKTKLGGYRNEQSMESAAGCCVNCMLFDNAGCGSVGRDQL